MNRRKFLELASSTGLALGASSWWSKAAASQPYGGPFFVLVNASGGFDPTLLCDPKGNSGPNDTTPINDYLAGDILDIGPFRVAPVDGHQAFFERFRNALLVINGVDAQTVSHETGTRHTWSGSMDVNSPAFGALVAAAATPRPTLGFLSNGGYDRTGGLIAPTRIPDTRAIESLAWPNRLDSRYPESNMFSDAAHARIEAARAARLDRLHAGTSLPREARAMEMLNAARSGDNELSALAQYLPDVLDTSNPLYSQAQVAMAAFRAGVSVSASMEIGGFDTHGDHDFNHRAAMAMLVAGITFAMDEAERQGIADQIVLVVGSEFGRTPWYNETAGKDHWSVTSMMAMGPGIRGGRVIGGTTDEQYALAVNPTTLALDPSGINITPAHVHASLRQLAGIADDPLVVPWPLVEPLPLFT